MAQMKRDDCQTLTIPEVAARLGIGERSAYVAAHAGEIPSLKVGNRRVVPLVAFERFLSGDWQPRQQPTSIGRNFTR
jgi:excisionase family DNA binding protein